MGRVLTMEEMEQLLLQAETGRLGLCQDGTPYVVPLSFWYTGDVVYFHGSPAGRKAGAIRAGGRACFLVDRMEGMQKAEHPCAFNVAFQSVMVEGNITVVEDEREKLAALKGISARYGGVDAATRLSADDTAHTAVFKLIIESKSGRGNP